MSWQKARLPSWLGKNVGWNWYVYVFPVHRMLRWKYSVLQHPCFAEVTLGNRIANNSSSRQNLRLLNSVPHQWNGHDAIKHLKWANLGTMGTSQVTLELSMVFFPQRNVNNQQLSLLSFVSPVSQSVSVHEPTEWILFISQAVSFYDPSSPPPVYERVHASS